MYDFGLTDSQFWKLTPLKFQALSRRHDAAIIFADSHAARICSVVANAAGAKKKNDEPYLPSDFMPDYGLNAEPTKHVEMKPDQILHAMKAALPGKKKPKKEARGG